MKTLPANRITLFIWGLSQRLCLYLCLCLLGHSVYAQQPAAPDTVIDKKPLLQVGGSVQFWLRYTELNPGSVVEDKERTTFWDISIRRYRLRLHGNATEKLRYTLELGNNDLNVTKRDQQLPQLLDAYVDYQWHRHHGLGFGKQAWVGPARYAAPATMQALAYDIDFVAAPLVNVHDDILRRLGLYARGRFNKLDYRVSLAKPSRWNNSDNPGIGAQAAFSDRRPAYQTFAYVKYQFLEEESQLSPYLPGTYLGKKNILNLGIGFLYQPNTSWSLQSTDTVYHAAASIAADVFWEHPLPRKKAVTAYASYIRHQFGPDFMRYMGANNPATASLATDWVNGRGNNAPVIGTGELLYLQLGYLQPVNNTQHIQAYGSLELARFDALHDPVILYNTGVSYLLNSHRSKITLGYQNRPLFRQTEHLIKAEKRKAMLVMQYQLLFGS